MADVTSALRQVKGVPMEDKVMSLTLQQKRGLFWALGIVTVATLTSLAWHQITAALTHCVFTFVK